MPDVTTPTKPHQRTAAGRVEIKVSIDRDAWTLLRSLASSRRGYGDVISRLAYQEQTRMEERERLREKLQEVLSEP